jgi:hypothetical protein
MRVEGGAWSAQRIPTAVDLGFLDRNRYFLLKTHTCIKLNSGQYKLKWITVSQMLYNIHMTEGYVSLAYAEELKMYKQKFIKAHKYTAPFM